MVLDGVLDASGASSPGSGGGGAGGSILLKLRDVLKGFGKIKSVGGNTVGTDSGAGSGGRIAVYTGSVAFFCFEYGMCLEVFCLSYLVFGLAESI